MRARRFLQSGLAFTNAVSKRGRTVATRGTKLGARVCAPLYECASTYAARSCLMTLRVAEFNNRTMYRACAFVTAPLAIKPATARSIEGRAPPGTAHAPVLAPGRAAGASWRSTTLV